MCATVQASLVMEYLFARFPSLLLLCVAPGCPGKLSTDQTLPTATSGIVLVCLRFRRARKTACSTAVATKAFPQRLYTSDIPATDSRDPNVDLRVRPAPQAGSRGSSILVFSSIKVARHHQEVASHCYIELLHHAEIAQILVSDSAPPGMS